MPRYAAVDIGSNSVRMMAAEVNQETIRVLAEERQVTRLGESVFRTGRISEEALTFLSATLARMAAVYQKLSVDRVRAVATARSGMRVTRRSLSRGPARSWAWESKSSPGRRNRG